MMISKWLAVLKKRENFRYVLIGAIVIGFLVVDVIGYRWYIRRYNERAQLALAEALDVYQKASREKAPHLWEEARQALAKGHEDFAGSSLDPYFLAYESDVVRYQGDHAKAVALMTAAVRAMSKSSPLYGPYQIKLALIKVDSPDQKVHADGLADLEQLAQRGKSDHRDEALYYRGLIAFDSADRAMAEKYWNELIKEFGKDSVWAQVAQAKLDYMA